MFKIFSENCVIGGAFQSNLAAVSAADIESKLNTWQTKMEKTTEGKFHLDGVCQSEAMSAEHHTLTITVFYTIQDLPKPPNQDDD